MFTVVIPKVVTRPTKLVDKKTGELRTEQLVKIAHPDLFTEVQGTYMLESGQAPFEPGTYELSGDSIRPGEYGRPEFRLVIGKRIDIPAKKVAA